MIELIQVRSTDLRVRWIPHFRLGGAEEFSRVDAQRSSLFDEARVLA